jgi:hypothetical protein
MGRISEKDFDPRDKNKPDYSSIEYDLYAKLGLTLVKNHKLNRYEIITIKDREVKYHGTLQEMADKANELEQAKNTIII